MTTETARTAETATLGRTSPFPPYIYEGLPGPMKSIFNHLNEPHVRDMLLLSSLPVMAGHFVNVVGIHNEGYFTPDLFIIIVAPPASGKGIINKARHLGDSLQKHLVESDSEVNTLFIPANTSSRALHDTLNRNNGRGIIFETEMDALNVANGQEWGNFDELLRKGFHHEPVSLNRKKDLIHINRPEFSMVMSGTLGQFMNMFQSAENGLYSRCAFYWTNPPKQWKSHRPTGSTEILQEDILKLDLILFEKYNVLISRETPIKVFLKEKHWDRIDIEFEKRMHAISGLGVEDYFHATNRRMPIIVLRVAMILTIMRSNHDRLKEAKEIYVSDQDIYISLRIAEYLVRHSLHLYIKMRGKYAAKKINNERIRELYKLLPNEFRTSQALALGEKLNISERTVEYHLPKLFKRVKQGHYMKIL